MDEESKARSEHRSEYLAATTATYYNSENRLLFEDDRSTLECCILSEFGWTTTIQQQQNILHPDPFGNNDDLAAAEVSIPKSDASSSVAGEGLMLRAADQMPSRLVVVEQASSTSTNNLSASSSSSDHQDPVDQKSTASDIDRTPPPNAQISCTKKRGQKRIRQQRFAFVTKSDVDHLEDGYRWRKYGQKAVKNSPYPRSYYRCTNTKCTVKKRVERSCDDPTTVITTYEGQHCHQTAGFPRGGLSIREAAFGVEMGPPNSQYYYPAMHLPLCSQLPTSVPCEVRNDSRMIVSTDPPMPPAGSTPRFPSDEGLLGDIVSPSLRNNFQP